ncbi:unnamed protein product [Sphagnum jensenii]
MKSEIFLHHAKSRTPMLPSSRNNSPTAAGVFSPVLLPPENSPLASHRMRILPRRCVRCETGLALRAKCERDKPAIRNSEAKE